MSTWLQSILGSVTVSEIALVGLLFGSILLFSWAPRLGEAVGGWFDDPQQPGSNASANDDDST